MSARIVPQRGFNFDYITWIFMRISGLALILFGVVGGVGALLMGARMQVDMPTFVRWVFFPNPNHVINSNIPDVAIGWATAYWQIMQILAVVFGVTHGLNGLRNVIEDYTGHSLAQLFWRALIILLWLFVIVTAVFVILAS
jgi:succinate dehydrogenase hydrophobic anchor subunit